MESKITEEKNKEFKELSSKLGILREKLKNIKGETKKYTATTYTVFTNRFF
jgi:hypothetical protein